MELIDQRLKIALWCYIMFIMILVYFQPTICFNEDGDVKSFGISEKETLVPLWILALIPSIMIYFLLTIFVI